MKMITDILDWKLLSGSHEWPGPHGGTCINEAAIVVAGLPYKSVSSCDDLPPCFSRVIGTYLIGLNDRMGDATRQRLIEFAPRLSGSADTADVEQQRLEYIVIETVRLIVSMAMIAAELPDHASACRAVMTFGEAKEVAAYAAKAADAAEAAYTADAAKAAKAADAAYTADAAKAADAADAAYTAKAADAAKAAYAAYAAKAAYTAYTAYTADAAIDDHCIEIVRGALAIGNQALPIETDLIIKRAAEICAV